ncbi:MAG TPA: GNAT family N-acetyltransferase [Chitinophagaceae bacterium]|nr:GNAT family N-acetyltransferase [Chitinophagaceae bacterium]
MIDILIKRTDSNDPDFRLLVSHLDHELWNELKEDQSTYDQYNQVPDLPTVVLIFSDRKPVASGCFKKYSIDTVEIKRMFVEKECRGRGISKLVLGELEAWARESGFQFAILETSIHFKAARRLYTNAGYSITDNYDQYVTDNYDQYVGLEESVCMRKKL